MSDLVIAGLVTTPFARRNGHLSGWHPVDLAAVALNELTSRTGLDVETLDQVIFGCAEVSGAQSQNIGRGAVLAAGWPESIPGWTVEGRGGSGHQAFHAAVAAVRSGAAEVVVVGGVEMASIVPAGATINDGRFGFPFGNKIEARYEPDGGLLPMVASADAACRSHGISRSDLDAYCLSAYESAAVDEDAVFEVSARVRDKDGGRTLELPELLSSDQLSEPFESLDKLPPVTEDGVLTAAHLAPAVDGASAAIVTTRSVAARLELPVLASVTDVRTSAVSPLEHPVAAAASATHMKDGVDAFVVDESTAATPLLFASELAIDPGRVNAGPAGLVRGEAAGASGLRMLSLVMSILRRDNGTVGLVASADELGGGLATRIELA